MGSETLNCVLLGSNSDIAKAITPMLESDGYSIRKWSRGTKLRPEGNWDLCIITLGMVKPVGLWHDVDVEHWKETIYSNLTLPFELLRKIWPEHNPGSTVIWFSGSNPNAIMSGYSAYNTSKMAVLKLIEQLDAETSDCKFVALGPGVTDTKIHKATIEEQWPNPRLERAWKDGSFTPMENIYKTLRWCLEQSKEVIGGRNICVSDLPLMWPESLKDSTNMFKLRRVE